MPCIVMLLAASARIAPLHDASELHTYLRSKDATCRRALSIAQRSRCPAGAWKNAQVSQALLAQAHEGQLVYLNAGANKGFGVAEFLQRFDGARAPSSPTNREWFKSIRAIKPSGMFQCGMCGACKDPPGPRYHNASSVRVFAFELLKSNHWLLRQLFERHDVPGKALNVAVSNYTGVAWAPTGVRTGQEWSSAEFGQATSLDGRRLGKGLAAVPSITLDSFATQQRLLHVHWLSIDAEVRIRSDDPLINP